MGASVLSGPRMLAALFFLLSLVSGPVQAIIIDVQFVDDTLFANQLVEIEAEYLGCPGPRPNVDGIQSEVRRDGSVIDLYYSVADVPCGVPPQGPVLSYTLGLLPQGDYTLRYVDIVETESFPPNMDGLDPQVVAFSVGEPVFVPIPTLNAWALGVLALIMVGIGVYRSRQLRSHTPAG